MLEQNVVGEVRVAKTWVDAQAASFAEFGAHLRAIEQAFAARTGQYSGVPRSRPQSVQTEIEKAQDEPGQGLLNESRKPR